MGAINIRNLKPGMVLASPVRNLQGVMILGEGIEITHKHLSMLKSWGPLEVDVEEVKGNDQDTEFSDVDEEIITAVDKDFELRFADVQQNKVMDEIKRVARQQTIKKMINGE